MPKQPFKYTLKNVLLLCLFIVLASLLLPLFNDISVINAPANNYFTKVSDVWIKLVVIVLVIMLIGTIINLRNKRSKNRKT